jgi:hypothetical protein
MSWDKNTLNNSIIPDIIVLLKAIKIKHKVTEIKRVLGHGCNDEIDTYYTLNKLEVSNMIYIDQIIRTADCDTDDTIITHKFSKEFGIPKNFKIEIELKDYS